jgi:menaquinone-dependent protoporphyrinogen oxidase
MDPTLRAQRVACVRGCPHGVSASAADVTRWLRWLHGSMTTHAASPNHVFKAANALVVYASTHGHTARIAARIADSLRAEGLEVDVRDVTSADDAEPGRYDLVVVGASLHKEHHQKAIVDWVRARHEALARRPSAFFSVSLSAAEDSDESRTATTRCIDELCAQTGWTPTRTAPIAGCLQYREYDVFTRQLMRLLMKRMGHPTDASHDYDYTDWAAVDRFGRELAQLAGVAAGT